MKVQRPIPLNALYGKGLGLTVLQNGGTVWESVPTTMIRGLNSTRDNSILVLIDGFERSEHDYKRRNRERSDIKGCGSYGFLWFAWC